VTASPGPTLAPADPTAFADFALGRGWGDGLPLVPPTRDRVEAMLAEAGLDPDLEIAALPPSGAICTAEALAVNAVLAGAPAAALPLLAAAVDAIAHPRFELHGINATTAPAVPMLVANGPVRDRLGIASGAGCLGGAEGSTGPAIGRALRLVIRNVARQRIGVTSQSVFGHPSRLTGLVFGEWEERSPWPSFAARRGVPGDAVTAFAMVGTINVCNILVTSADLLLQFIGRSMAVPGCNGFHPGLPWFETAVLLNPVWAETIGAAYPDVDDVARLLWEAASLPVDEWPADYQRQYEELDRIDDRGRVHVCQSPEEILVFVSGGLGGLHATVLPSWGTTQAQTRAIAGADR
jgi:hypothetical protein